MWEKIPGWTCARLLELYDEIAAPLGAGDSFVETGVAYGRSLTYFLDRGWRHGVPEVFGVDVWAEFMGGDQFDLSWAHRYGNPLGACEAMLRQHGGRFSACIQLVQKTATAAAAEFADGSVSAVFIDDDHRYEGVRDAIAAWRPKVKRGGILSGHDVNANFPGVERAVREAFGEHHETRATDDGWGGVWLHHVK